MEFRLLGPLEVVGDDGVPVALGGPRPRALLARLLLEPNRAVSNDRLIDALWGESPPPSAHNAVQVPMSTRSVRCSAPTASRRERPATCSMSTPASSTQTASASSSGAVATTFRSRSPSGGAGPRRSGR